MLSQQELSDRFEIQDLIYRYAQLVDGREIDALRTVFTEDAHIDYSAMGGAVGRGYLGYRASMLPTFAI